MAGRTTETWDRSTLEALRVNKKKKNQHICEENVFLTSVFINR